MNASNSSAPGSSTPGGELQQISPGAWPTVDGGQTENRAPFEIKGDWNTTKGRLKQKWDNLTDADLEFVEGQHAELCGRIQERTGASLETVEKAFKEASVRSAS